MRLTLGFSPCPNDTFVFDALVNGKMDTEGLSFDVVLEDVQTLNDWVAAGKLDVTKLSFPALFANTHKYIILDAGSALGQGVGPLLIAKSPVAEPDVAHCKIAVPGTGTTANFLLRYAFPQVHHTVPMLFSEIEDAVLNGDIDLGVIIHENRFTYQQKGLHKVCDLGEVWESREGVPIPLGCIAAKKSLPQEVKAKVDRLIKQSLQYAHEAGPELSPYVKRHAQAMDETVMQSHINLYVNDYTLSLGVKGREAINKLYGVYQSLNGGADAAHLFSS